MEYYEASELTPYFLHWMSLPSKAVFRPRSSDLLFYALLI